MNRSSVRATLPFFLLLLGALSACGGAEDGAGGAGGEGGAGGAGGAGGGDTTSTGNGMLEGPPRYFLRVEDGPPPPIVLELDKQKALEVFGEDAARQITLLDVDSTEMLLNVLERIQNACGTGWEADAQDPNHNCNATLLGQSFGPSWQTTPEFAMVRLLGMTPANANITGTSLADFRALIDGNPGTFGFTFSDVLAETLGITRTSPFIPLQNLVTVLQQQLMGTHPAVNNPAGTLPITMYDALLDMTPLSTKLGPTGDHPGVLVPDDPSFTTKSDALQPDFRMRVVAESNLRWVSGVDLSDGAGDMFLRQGDAALAFDFNDPERLQIQGIAPSPTVDMRFALSELPAVVPSCATVEECKGNYPSTPVGNGTVWTLDPWLLEPIVAGSGLLTYGNRDHEHCYIIGPLPPLNCRVGVFIGQGGPPNPHPVGPPGWTLFVNTMSFSGEPPLQVPAPQFLWELLTEVAQVAVHDPTGDGVPDVPEGAAPAYALRGVPIGLTDEELVAQMRPTLQGQAGFISDVILGRFWKNNDALDFYYHRPTPGGRPYLYFVDASDLRPGGPDPDAPRPYAYANPGFFSSPDLSHGSKVSTTVIAGVEDTTHEKYLLPEGYTYLYMQDDEGLTYEVRFYVPEAGSEEITAEVNRLSP